MTAPATTALADFLFARIAEDEAKADQTAAAFSGLLNGRRSREQLECDAKRRIVDWHHRIPLPYERGNLLRMLALPYANHPDYDEAWRG